MFLQADAALDYKTPEVDVILEIMHELKVLTTDLANNHSLYPNDLFQGTNLMNRIAGVTPVIQEIMTKLDVFSQVRHNQNSKILEIVYMFTSFMLLEFTEFANFSGARRHCECIGCTTYNAHVEFIQ